jgi:hypothetical protein
MSQSPPKLTPAIQQAIVAYVRAGGFPHVAAEAAGVPAETFERWMQLGERPRAAAKYRELADAIRQAVAQARLGAELQTRSGKPLDWLRGGPGRPSAAGDGWTGPARAAPAKSNELTMLSPEVQQLIATLLEVLRSHPEARAAVVAALQQFSPDSARKSSHRRSTGA